MGLTRFFPQSHDFFSDFTAAAANVQDTAHLVAALFAGTQSVAEGVERLRTLEHRGDAITRAILTALGTTFLPALRPGDIRDLALRLDDVVDALDEAGRRLYLYRLPLPMPAAQHLPPIAQLQADVLVHAMSALVAGNPAETMHLLVELHRLENEADEVIGEVHATLYDGVTDVPGVIRARQWGELYELLEDAIDCVERAAHTLEDIVSERL